MSAATATPATAPAARATRVRLTMRSSNPKTGHMPVATTERASCPPSCPFRDGHGCYAENAPLIWRWQELDNGKAGVSWDVFCGQVANLPTGTTWRYGQAGDLPGDGEEINEGELAALVWASRHTLPIAFTHKPVLGDLPVAIANRAAIADANAAGFTVNLSADDLADADRKADLGIAPVVVVLDRVEGERHDVTTPAGRRVATCPATYAHHADGSPVTCLDCRLCARRDRKVIVGFPAHGARTKAAAAVASGRA